MKQLILAIFSILSITAVADTHLFILSGQSNMYRMDPEKGFVPEIKKLLPSVTINYVKDAHSGNPISQWIKGWDKFEEFNSLKLTKYSNTKQYGRHYSEIMKLATPLLAEKPSTITFVWMQGESDAKIGSASIYAKSLNTLVARLRQDLNAPDMNVVICRISDFGSKHAASNDWPGWAVVRKAQEEFVINDPHSALVNTDDCNGRGDGLHYPKEGYELMGRRMARQAALLIKGDKPVADGMPE